MDATNLITLALSALAMLVAMLALVPAATRMDLVDVADGVRKHHDGAIPLVGGPALVAVLLLAWAAHSGDGFAGVLAAVSIVTVLVGAIDDRLDLSATLRLLVQLVLSAIVVLSGGVAITHLGDLAGNAVQLHLGWLSPWISIAALAAAMNAFNMLDGIDGQAAGLAWIAALGVGVAAILAGSTPPVVAIVLAGALPAFLFINLKQPGGRLPKCFLGDSGALLLGLHVGVLLIGSAREPDGWAAPVTVLWFAALPLFDTLFVMGYRMLHGRSPLSADRNHLHHLLLDHGATSRGALALVMLAAAGLAATGLVFERTDVPEMTSFLVLFGLFLSYVSVALLFHKRRPDASRLARAGS
jgi:UDP-GlcNAc:undecaprenyl-phosphate GlcNAc-1-phosphate transferase